MSAHTQTITITYGDHAENHRGMQIISQSENEMLAIPAMRGLTVADLEKIGESLTGAEFSTELHRLDFICHPDRDNKLPDAAILIIRGGVNKILKAADLSADDMYDEQIALTPDKMVLNSDGRVVKKIARWNLCYADWEQKADILNGRGTVIPWSQVPISNAIRRFISILHPKFRHLVGEGNFYYKPESCGIRPHGDLERSVVVAARLGVAMPLFYQWYNYGRPIYSEMRFNLEHGDMYIMSARAVGTDNAKSRGPILKHWACGPKFRLRDA